MANYCGGCGQVTPPQARYCGSCGAALKGADSSPPSPAWEPGARVGPYRLLQCVGRTDMSLVFKALQLSLERPVAIKVLTADPDGPAQLMKRFRRESRAVSSLRHPNIVYVNDTGEHAGRPYLVMEYAEGGTLGDRLQGPLAPDYVGRILSQVASALTYAHERGVVHRDLKPANILLQRPDWALLTDFGVAKLARAQERLTHSGWAVGTPHYMSPEQAGGLSVDRRSDIYSLGAVVYHMLTGAPPFVGHTPAVVGLQHVTLAPPPLRERNADIKPSVEEVVLRALAKDPRERFASAAEFAEAYHAAYWQRRARPRSAARGPAVGARG